MTLRNAVKGISGNANGVRSDMLLFQLPFMDELYSTKRKNDGGAKIILSNESSFEFLRYLLFYNVFIISALR